MNTEIEILEGNKIIAEFMGLHFHKRGWVDAQHIDGNYECEDLKYHSSWDCIMPVVEKIEVLGYNTFLKGHDCMICSLEPPYVKVVQCNNYSNKIEATWFAIIEFIQWYNNRYK